MDFGIAVATPADSWKVVKRAEELGFSHAWFYDTQMLSADCFVAMGAAAETAWGEVSTFLVQNTRQNELAFFMELAEEAPPEAGESLQPSELPVRVVVPAFILSELKTAFQMGFLLFLPFLVIDLVIASVLLSMGMFMLPPVMISLLLVWMR